jgi:type IV secretory pathway VirB10-like protein
MSGRIASPGMLLPPPRRGKGIRRLNRGPIWIGTGAICVVLATVAYTYQQRMARQQEAAAAADTGQTQGAASHAKEIVTIQPATSPPAPPVARMPAQQAPGAPQVPMREVQQAATVDIAEDARKKAWAAYYQQIAQVEQAKADANGKALVADTDATGTNAGSFGGGQAAMTTPPSYTGGPGAALAGLPSAGVDAGAQAEKRAFLAQDGDPLGLKEDLQAGLHGMKTDTIMEGTALPGVMIGGLTSDMPGMIVGSISQNVYDTASGNDLLIPQGSRVVGSYDNSVSNGQKRIGVIWNRIIFPDTSSIQLGAMEGADQGGYAGFKDRVDTHFWDKFAAATIISIAGAAAQVAQPQQSAFSGYSPTSVASGQLTQGYSQLGQEYARAGLSIPNTIEIRPGYAFTLMVAKDVHLPPYVDHRNDPPARAARGPIFQ